jgi:hypothetical protein
VIVVDRNVTQIRVQLDALPKDALDALGGAGAADKIAVRANGASWQLTKVRTMQIGVRIMRIMYE